MATITTPAEFHFPVRSADIWGLNNAPDEPKPSTEDIAANLEFQDQTIEDYLSHTLPNVYIQQSSLGSGTIDPTQLASGTATTGYAPVYNGTEAVWTDIATQAELNAHIAQTPGAHAASAISFTPTGTIASTDVQAAIAEVAIEAGGSTPNFNMTFLLMGA